MRRRSICNLRSEIRNPRSQIRVSAIRNPQSAIRNQRGFTLIEVTVTATILLILLGFLFIPTLTAFNLFHVSQAKGEVQGDVRFAMEQMSRELSQAVEVRLYQTPTDYDNNPLTNENYDRISFRMPARDSSSGQVQLPLRPDHHTTALNTGNLPYWITYYRRPANMPPAVYNPSDPEANPLVLYRVEFTPTGTRWETAVDLASTATAPVACLTDAPWTHTAVTAVEDDHVSLLSFATSPGDPDSIAINLRLRRSEYSGSSVQAPQAQLKNVIRPPNAVIREGAGAAP